MPNDSRPIDLVADLRAKADRLMFYAEGVSNLRKPEKDNEFGREATLMRSAADEIERLTAERNSIDAAMREEMRENARRSEKIDRLRAENEGLRLALEIMARKQHNGPA